MIHSPLDPFVPEAPFLLSFFRALLFIRLPTGVKTRTLIFMSYRTIDYGLLTAASFSWYRERLG